VPSPRLDPNEIAPCCGQVRCEERRPTTRSRVVAARERVSGSALPR
jgi:hypothetical protein